MQRLLGGATPSTLKAMSATLELGMAWPSVIGTILKGPSMISESSGGGSPALGGNPLEAAR